MAVAQFEKAIAAITVIDDSAKGLLYNLGGAYVQLGNLDKATGCYKQIYEADIGFKDVSEKIEKIYKEIAKKKKEANANN
jgi:tetratricopeptide (TPR) repeat protein